MNTPAMRHSLATSTVTNLTNLSVTKSSQVHIGPEFVSVTQNIKNTEVIKGRFLGIELVTSKQARRLQCSVAVFMGWVFLVFCAFAFNFIYIASPGQPRLDIGLKEPWYYRRADWQALDPYGKQILDLPIPYVIVRHTAANYCDDLFSCIKEMLTIQRNHFKRGFCDIGSNFLVGGNGMVFEGRGANVRGEMLWPWNVVGITITFMGNYRSDETVQAQFDHINELLDVLVEEGVLQSNYMLYGHCQVQPEIYSPGLNVILRLNNFAHWSSNNISGCLIK